MQVSEHANLQHPDF